MSRLIILGTAWAVPSPGHENTHMAIHGSDGVVLLDCPGSPTIRLANAGIPFDAVTDLILTHFHPDHVGGVPLLLMNMWMLGRQDPLRIYGLHHCLERVEDMMGFFHWDNWPEFFPVAFHRLPERERVLVLEKKDFRVYSSPVRHVIPTIGLRIESKGGGKTIAYSCDTEPCPSMVRLAEGAQVLIHEATGAIVGHSSASQAGAIAREAQVEHLVLIHYKAGKIQLDTLVEQAKETFAGDVITATDLMELEF
ncbi:MAG: MBL fold metallo-hydrolase [Anaerolineales bacterium]|nr:MBL fold metallo-hydrolase [Anaerolineales bacterium]